MLNETMPASSGCGRKRIGLQMMCQSGNGLFSLAARPDGSK
jgi:hypothetical protein